MTQNQRVITGMGFITLIVVLGFLLSGCGEKVAAKPLPRATTPTATIAPPRTPWSTPPPKEDEAGFDCRSQGNRICGPGSGHDAGCYNNGVRVIAWSNYRNPKKDFLWGRATSPCSGETRHLPEVDGHSDCWVIIGDTSRVYCKDGYRTTS